MRTAPVLVAAATLALVLTLPDPPTQDLSFAVASDRTLVAALGAGIGLLAAGVVAAVGRSGADLPVALTVAAVAWLAPELVAREDAPGLVRAAAAWAAPLLGASMLHVGLTLSRWPGPVVKQRVLRIGYGVVGALSLFRLLVWSPGLDPHCWSNCTSNVLLVRPVPELASLLTAALDLITGMVAAGAGFVAVRAIWTDRTRVWSAAPLVAAGAALGVHSATRLGRPFETPLDASYVRLFELRAGTLAALAVGTVVLVLLDERRRSRLRRVVAELADVGRGRSLEELLRDATGDTGLVVRYPVGDADLLDAEGRRHPWPDADGVRVATPLVRDGREVAVVVHDATRVGVEELRRAASPAVQLAVENERLRAELLMHLAELQASRARLVAASDAERRGLERDLHDGAQHRLLALGHDVRRAREVAGDADGELAMTLRTAELGVQEAVAELRTVARGLYPAVLTAEGLEGALWSLSDSAPVPLEILSVPGRRYAEAVERTVYAVVGEAVEAVRRLDEEDAEGVTAAVREADGVLVVDVTGIMASPPVMVLDRVGALGGVVHEGPAGWHVELPCG